MEPQLVRLDVLLFATFLDQLSGQFCAFPRGHHPADDIPAEDIEDDVKVKVGPLGGAAQLGDVPTPQLIGGGGQQFWFLIRGVGELIAALARCPILRRKSPARYSAWPEQNRPPGQRCCRWPSASAEEKPATPGRASL